MFVIISNLLIVEKSSAAGSALLYRFRINVVYQIGYMLVVRIDVKTVVVCFIGISTGEILVFLT